MTSSILTEDSTKLHGEVNQIMQQRFALTTFAVGIFGVMIAWGLPKSQPTEGATLDNIAYIVSCAVNIVLGVLFALHLCLKLYARVLTTYLEGTPSSQWEIIWAKWRGRRYKYIGYSTPQTCVFVLLGVLSTLYPTIVGLAYGLRHNQPFLVCAIVLGSIYVLSAIFLGTRYRFKKLEELFRRQWESLLPPSSDSAAPIGPEQK